MKDHDGAVCGQLNIKLDGKSLGGGALKGGKGIFGHALAPQTSVSIGAKEGTHGFLARFRRNQK